MLLAWVAILDGLRCYETPKEVWLRSLTARTPTPQQQQHSPYSAWDGPSYYDGAVGGSLRPFPPVGDPFLQPRFGPLRSQHGGHTGGGGHGGDHGGMLWPPKHHPKGEVRE